MIGVVARPMAIASRSSFSQKPFGPAPLHFSFWSAK